MTIGDIGAPVNTREFELTDIARPDMILVAGDVYAIAYTNAAGDAVVATIDITGAGVIGANILDDEELTADGGAHPSIVHVAGEVYAIAYRGTGVSGFIKTVEITALGAISAVGGGSLEFETDSCYEPDMIKVPGSSGVFAIVCRGDANQGIINTVTITDAGAISAIQMKEAWATNVNGPNICHVSGNIFAIVYRDNAYDGFICTMSISTAGVIGAAVEDEEEFDIDKGSDPDICHVSGSIFAIAYRGTGDTGFVLTVTIDGAGTIALVGGAAGKLEFYADYCTWPNIIHLESGVCAIAHGGAFDDGFVATVQIDAAGQITALDSLEIDTANGTYPSIVRVSGDQYAVTYVGEETDGFIKTPTIETPVLGGVKNLLMFGVG